ncbi:MAG: hypothetical protein KAW52_00370 [candidate division Zixibacteria bacterium]|nr:hypothetical protein [candidate division Zixibacteria bacterium]
MTMTTNEIVSLNKIKLTAEVVSMIVGRMELKNIRKDTAIWMIRDKIHELRAEFEKLQVMTPIDETVIK